MKELLKDEALQAQAAQALKSMQQAAQDVKKTQQQIKSHKKAEKKLSKTKKKAEKKSQAVQGEVVAAAAATEGAPKGKVKAGAKKKRHPVRKLLVVATIGAVVAMVVSEDARKVALDLLFGAEEEFEYTSNVSSASGSSNGAS